MYIDSELITDEFGAIDKEYYLEKAYEMRRAYFTQLVSGSFSRLTGAMSVELPAFFYGPLGQCK